MTRKLSKVDREIRDHPERFDFGDVPPMGSLTPEHARQLDERRPDYIKKRLAEAQE